MAIRSATHDDVEGVLALFHRFVGEVPLPNYVVDDDGRRRQFVEEHIAEHVAVVAEATGVLVGFLFARMRGPALGYVEDMYVVPDARRSGVAAALLRSATTELRARGAEAVALEVYSENRDARVVYERWGFRETRAWLEASARQLEDRLSEEAPEPSYGLVFVQSDDTPRVDQAVRSFIPRLGPSARTEVRPPVDGWIAVDDELCSGDPFLLRRLAQELSYRTGAIVLALGVEQGAVVRYVLFDRGTVADEYASVPDYGGPLPPGDVVALSANPTVAHRLTGADPERVRATARTAPSPADLPAAEELYADIAAVLGVPVT